VVEVAVPQHDPEPAEGPGGPPPAVTRWTARLVDPALEQRFRAHQLPGLRRDATIAAGAVIAYNCYSALASAVRLGPGGALAVEAANNVVLVVLALALVGLARRTRSYDRLSRALLVATGLYGSVVVAELAYAPESARRAGVLVIVTAAVIYLHALLPVVHSAGLALLWSAGGVLALVHQGATAGADLVHLLVLLGVLNLVGLVAVHRTGTGERLLFAQQQAVARLAGEDGLTGLANRRTLSERLQQEWRRCARASLPLSLVIVDVDRFKQVNDEHGHAGGDDVLRLVAEVLTSSTHRAADAVARYGGDEFVVLLPGTGSAGARQVAERVLADLRLRRAAAPRDSAVARLSVSIGAATSSPAHGDPAALMATADARLYRAKAQGRDQVVADDQLVAGDEAPAGA